MKHIYANLERPMVINTLKNEFLEDFIVYGNSESSRRGYDFELTRFLNYLDSLGINEITTLSAKCVKDYLKNIRNVKTNNELSPASRARIQSALKSFLEYLYKNDHIEVDLAAKLEKIKTSQKESPYLSQTQCLQFIEAIKKQSTSYYRDRDLALMNILIKTGIRRAEIVNLDVSDVDLVQARIWVKRKGGSEGYIPLLDELVEDLGKYLKTLNKDANQPLFTSKRGNRLSASSVWHLVKVYARKADLNPKITVHSLRHGFATKLHQSGVSIPTIQKLMGHRSPTTTYRYVHTTDNSVREEFNNKVSFDERR